MYVTGIKLDIYHRKLVIFDVVNHPPLLAMLSLAKAHVPSIKYMLVNGMEFFLKVE